MPVLTWMGVPGTAEAWSSCGFDVADGGFALSGVRFAIGERGWGFDELSGDTEPLGVPTRIAPKAEAVRHPNAIDGIDHIVYSVPDLDAAVTALDTVGLDLRRRFHPRGPDGPEMAFYRAGTVIEVVAGSDEPALWGVAFRSSRLDESVSAMKEAGAPIGDPKPAVQGGRIASVWKEHVGWGVAVMGD